MLAAEIGQLLTTILKKYVVGRDISVMLLPTSMWTCDAERRIACVPRRTLPHWRQRHCIHNSRRKYMLTTRTLRQRMLIAGGAALTAAALLTGCTSNEPTNTGPTNNTENEETGEKIVIGFSGPAADHGWLGAINS